MNEEILEVLWDIINDGKQPDIAYKELCVLFDVSQQSEPFINFAKEVIEYYEQHDIGDEDIYNKAKKLINGG